MRTYTCAMHGIQMTVDETTLQRRITYPPLGLGGRVGRCILPSLALPAAWVGRPPAGHNACRIEEVP